MTKIRKLFKRLLELILNIINKIFIHFKILKEEENMKKNMPIRDIDYFDTLINFLIDNSNERSGIDFSNRLEKLYLDSIESINQERKLTNQLPYIPHPNFLLELKYADVVWVRNMISNNFLQIVYDNTSFYKIIIKYRLGENENNNIQDADYIMNIFNNYCHNTMIFPELPIFCTEVIKENRYLVFTFIHYGKHKEIKNKEIDFRDEDFH